METAWLFNTLTVTVARIDFLDPAMASEPDARERGVRVEVRPTAWDHVGSVYASPNVTLQPAALRIDLLESAPGAVDRMHWHPTMAGGEPGDRVFDTEIPADPLGWLSGRLDDVLVLLTDAGVADVQRYAGSADQVKQNKPAILDAVRAGMEWARDPWPTVEHDERGMAVDR